VRRVAAAVLSLGCAFVLCFLLLHAIPGDPADRVEIPGIPPEQAQRSREALGLDLPLPAQLLRTLASYARLDLGVSIGRHRPVIEVLAGALPSTLLLGASALALAYGLGVSCALLALSLPGRPQRIADQVALVLATVPRFWLGIALVVVFHSFAGWLPASHDVSPGGGGALDRLRHLVLPSLALGLPAAAAVFRYALASMQSTLAAPHVRTARASGSAGLPLVVRHVLRPSAGPTLSLLGLDVSVLVSGALVVEMVFAWPGMGRVTAEAVLGSDYPLALAASVLAAALVILGRTGSEMLAARLDTRQGGAA
jgi:peptide/nickel transport system permease protein